MPRGADLCIRGVRCGVRAHGDLELDILECITLVLLVQPGLHWGQVSSIPWPDGQLSSAPRGLFFSLPPNPPSGAFWRWASFSMFPLGSCPDVLIFQFETRECLFSAFPLEPAHDPIPHPTPAGRVGSRWEPLGAWPWARPAAAARVTRRRRPRVQHCSGKLAPSLTESQGLKGLLLRCLPGSPTPCMFL